MYFIEHLCEFAQRDNHIEFVRMMQRDILRVVDAVAPADGSGAANVRVVRKAGSPSSATFVSSSPNRVAPRSLPDCKTKLYFSLPQSKKSKMASKNATPCPALTQLFLHLLQTQPMRLMLQTATIRLRILDLESMARQLGWTNAK